MLGQNIIYTVHDLNAQVGKTLLRNYSSIWVEGEVSNYKKYPSGHSYFILKDSRSQINCVLFSSYHASLNITIKNGIKISVFGNITLYENRGQYQFQCINIIKSGHGHLWQQYIKLKEKLKEAGYFDNKLKIPVYPQRIGIITSNEGSVLKDMLRIIGRRAPSIEIDLYHSKTQGGESVDELSSGVRYFSKRKNIDLIIVARGGGSIEDLWSFNSEKLAKAIHKSTIPIISAVGHETDYTICDYVSDLRAATPSEAAELITQNYFLLNEKMSNYDIILNKCMIEKMKFALHLINNLKYQLELNNPKLIINSCKLEVNNYMLDLDKVLDRFFYNIKNIVDVNTNSIEMLNPHAILDKGYSIITNEADNIISDASMLNINDSVFLKFSKGMAQASIKTLKGDNG